MAGCGVTLASVADTLNCKVRVIGTPAEETFSAKVDMARLGAFEGVDFVFQAHLSKNFSMGAVTLAMYSVEFDFHGKSAHASINPQAGVNALDGVLAMFFNMNAMRQYLRDDARVHGIITNGGTASNVIPDFAQCQFEIRAKTRGYLDEIRRRLIAAAESAALATGTTMEYRDYENYNDEIINLKSFAGVCEKHFGELGISEFVPEEEYEGMGSSDLGNVSYLCPTVYAEVMLADGTPVAVHDQSAMEQVDSPAAHEMMRKVILAFTASAAEICMNSDLAGQIRAEWETEKKKRLK
jgi:amidohydrolase